MGNFARRFSALRDTHRAALVDVEGFVAYFAVGVAIVICSDRIVQLTCRFSTTERDEGSIGPSSSAT
jgi:hypothetical protein